MKDYPIKPSDIKTDQSWSAFGHDKTEISAKHLVHMAQKNGDWRDFTKKEIDIFSSHNFWFNTYDFCFNKLTDDGTPHPPIKKNDDGSYSFTHKFIAKCFLSSPAIDVVFP